MTHDGPSSENRDRGYIRLYRSQFDPDDALWRRSRKKSHWEAWAYLLSLAHYRDEPSEVLVRGRVVTVRRGEFVISQRELAQRLGWGRQEVRTFLCKLQKLGRIEPVEEPSIGLQKICNYGFYNGSTARSNPTSNPRANPKPTQHQPLPRKQEGEKRRRVCVPPSTVRQ